ncbi:aminopeptidase [Stutzerimonas stutzeri KOS6]|uniref:Aminopeptidase n=2 Tax=Stutzerimonas stutzeri TaxID=316 RepID=A0A061JJW8_STUST|nr:aminopeptidase [Stutzerimonas stutzeri KOS6]
MRYARRREPAHRPVNPMPKPNTALIDSRSLRWVPLLLAVCLNGCSYYGQLAAGQLELLRQREPIEQLIADESRDAVLRQRLAEVLQARRFASRALALPDNRSYRLYAELGRPYVVWNLFATEEFSVKPLEHCFPIAGCVAYRGYFRQGAARGEAARLRLTGLDTHVAGVEAYSTLGWFADPLLSSMLHRNDEHLAALIFHELAHQQLYLPGDTAFNESYASFVEREGLRQWRSHRQLPQQDEQSSMRYRQLVALLLDTRERLDRLYASGRPATELRALKRAAFVELRQRYRTLRDEQWGGDARFDRWFAQPLNNATLLPFGLYDRWVTAFAVLFEQSGRDWPRFHAAVAALAKLPADEREARLGRLAG